MAKLVHFGAGNIGRGFFGALFSKAGYEVVFIDVKEDVLAALNSERCYPLRIVGEETHEEIIKNVRAVKASDINAVAEEIATADIIGTSVGANVLKGIVPSLAKGIMRRWEKRGGPIDIYICENLMDADTMLRKELKAHIPKEKHDYLERSVGLVETSIARMVPVMTEKMQEGNLLRIWVEAYEFLPIDVLAMRSTLPPVPQLVPHTPFRFYLQRKLYIHNLGHAACAYWGRLKGYTYIYEAIQDPEIRQLVYYTMLESAQALAKQYKTKLRLLMENIEDLLLRFANKPLLDTIERVGRDTKRKLSANDRFIGAAGFATRKDAATVFISASLAAGLLAAEAELGGKAETHLHSLTGLKADDPTAQNALIFLKMLRDGDSLSQIFAQAALMSRARMGKVV